MKDNLNIDKNGHQSALSVVCMTVSSMVGFASGMLFVFWFITEILHK